MICIGKNYAAHAAEMAAEDEAQRSSTRPPEDEAQRSSTSRTAEAPANPIIFIKPNTSIIGPQVPILRPKSSSRVDYEGELAVVIGRPCRDVKASAVKDVILGYTVGNDVTARDQQKADGQWTRGKGFDTFAPVGPCIETELDPSNVSLATYVNGECRQSGNTSDLIFPVPVLISFISHVMTLLPGDIIATGTPAGISAIKPGDTVEIRIEPIGTLRNYVIEQE